MARGTHHVTESCRPVTEILQLIGDKWTVLVVRALYDGSRRFSEIRRDMPAVSQRMLTLTLRNLERNGLVTRTVTPSIPPRVDYELTKLGRSLEVPLRGLGEWAADNSTALDAARAKFDVRNKAEKKRQLIKA
ncbi:MAG: helix-turn-helix domain-containing protein [Hyphomonadaceae bacterium]|nr:helix-turn-helix domain-containing protein [Hyphomonadaceae bacterium]